MPVKKVIDWKLSELPVGTIVDGSGPTRSRSQYYKEEVHWAKDPFLWWSELAGGDYTEGRRDDEIDNLITDFEILSVPAEWYEEFKPLPYSRWSVNRAGWVKMDVKMIDASESLDNFIGIGSTFITVQAAVRKAFA